MNSQRFTEIVNAYGAKPARWPEAERDKAVAFMEAHPKKTADILALADQLDSALDSVHQTSSDASFLAARILKSAQQHDYAARPANNAMAKPSSQPSHQPAWRSIAATFVVTTGIGFAMGQSAAAKSARIAEAEALLMFTLDDPYESNDLWENLQ